jgi:hypothetical protein
MQMQRMPSGFLINFKDKILIFRNIIPYQMLFWGNRKIYDKRRREKISYLDFMTYFIDKKTYFT